VTLQPGNVPSYEEARKQFTHDYLVNNLQQSAATSASRARGQRNRTDFYKLLSRFRVSSRRLQATGSRLRATGIQSRTSK